MTVEKMKDFIRKCCEKSGMIYEDLGHSIRVKKSFDNIFYIETSELKRVEDLEKLGNKNYKMDIRHENYKIKRKKNDNSHIHRGFRDLNQIM